MRELQEGKLTPTILAALKRVASSHDPLVFENQSLANAYFQKHITLELALSRSSNQDELQEMIARGATFVNRGGAVPQAKGAAPAKR